MRRFDELPDIHYAKLGMGRNAHEGFNEEGSAFDSHTRVVELAPSTRADAAPSFAKLGEEPPTHAVTIGLGDVAGARKKVGTVKGEQKAATLKAVVEGPKTEEVPWTNLQGDPGTVIYADRAAAAALARGQQPSRLIQALRWFEAATSK